MVDKAINEAISLLKRMNKVETLQEKIHLLNQDRYVNELRKHQPELWDFFLTLSDRDFYLLLLVAALNQGKCLFLGYKNCFEDREKIHQIIEHLKALERFYGQMGGIVGYHLSFLQLLAGNKDTEEKKHFSQPLMFDLTLKRAESEAIAIQGIKALSQAAALFPMGGSGDRLGLIDPDTKEPLPAAFLPFMGFYLIEHLIREVEGLEHAYYKTFGEMITIPIAIMTSEIKQNHQKIVEFLEKNRWFSRPKESFFLFQQMSVPLITEEGKWGISSPLNLDLKPGGHGVIWKLMEEKGVFQWLENEHQKKWVFLRQINNPVGGVDLGYLPLLGVGSTQDKKMGFASCPRKVKSPEGMNVFCQMKKNDIYEQGITNIEYTDFEKNGIEDQHNDDEYSVYPSNTNIMVVQLDAVKEALKKNPYPGLMINLKNKTKALDMRKELVEKKAGRLELMMQNIADSMRDVTERPIETKEEQKYLSTFVTYNERRKTISVTKKLHTPDEPVEGTPRKAFYDYLKNCRELLSTYCNVKLPEERHLEEFLKKGPSFHFSYHPALGPLFSDIAKRLQNGSLAYRSEVFLNLKEIEWDNVSVEGSLLIDDEGDREFFTDGSFNASKVILRNVKVQNAGIDYEANNTFWKGDINRKESLQIHLERNAKLIIENAELIGNQMIVVPENTTLCGSMKGGKLVFAKRNL